MAHAYRLCSSCDVVLSTVHEVVLIAFDGALCSTEEKREAYRVAREAARDQHRRDVHHAGNQAQPIVVTFPPSSLPSFCSVVVVVAADQRAELAARAEQAAAEERKRGEAQAQQ